ncbi:hydroxymethylbilane synthase [Pseudemcibacter aquimaris]|uniref:hydroxymethylbilane synthase n=1 Tax=Pseudemcibacter aquimaris TaxID=2857064 RepID=UPI0020119743|nr:hydroxymethylbilane synthase [Pseudemcibacter aquimaris]MCC3861871.1 hydroxymethylbilane synthase [Pseudemcibacter aquimaris]WDU58624.1 hydroxymethylbilane synthase [Pseudemcibacter aquimaris]
MQETVKNNIVIGTRGSKLALAQAYEVKGLLIEAHDHLNEDNIDIKVMSTRGDRVQDRNLSEIGGKGLFTEEIEDALYKGDVDIAVHSLKDMPTRLPTGLELVCYLEREDVRDAFLSSKAKSLKDLPEGAVLGTSSLRRKAQALALRPDLEVVNFRGNVQTRLKKLDDNVADATFLAMAGLNRLDIDDPRVNAVETEDLLPAVAQGAITIEIASSNDAMREILAPLNHKETELRVRAERRMLDILDGSCRTPIAGLAVIEGETMTLTGRVLDEDGTNLRHDVVSGDKNDPEALGDRLGQLLKCASS